ncbi:allene oxide synthase 3-like [Amaranthus tricolor]|uniref:allene oxide synthase 3-like n=1 Tax=Amaranthus tricolor TaxID=29722 RepID=UPI00258FBADD|nr:allene oxide synthase 3-like [Amaranthus tricolor]
MLSSCPFYHLPKVSNVLSSSRSSNLPLPLCKIPGGHGLPFFGPMKDRWDFFYAQGREEYFRSRMEKYNSTVFRANLPPGPWISSDPRVVVLLDANSFPVLFDNSKVDKRDVFAGTYMPSTTFTGGFRTCPYLDPSEPEHGSLKALFLSVLTSHHEEIIPLFQRCLKGLFHGLEAQLKRTGQAEFGPSNDALSLEFFFRLLCDGKSPLETKIESKGPYMLKKWIFCQVAPMITLELPKFLHPIEDFMLHSFRIPFKLVQSDYYKLYDAFSSSAKSFLDKAESFGLSREEACHNLVCVVGFNSFGISKWFPSLMTWVACGGKSLHRELAEEIRSVVRSEGGITFNAINKMALTKSVVYEALRIEPPTPFQFGKAKEDFVIQSHDSTFSILKGELILGYQPFAMKDPNIFDDPEKFIANRFVGEGEKLLKYVFWSNGRGIDEPTVHNKQCPAKNLVELISRVLLIEFFLRYDTFTAKVGNLSNPNVTFLTLKKASRT